MMNMGPWNRTASIKNNVDNTWGEERMRRVAIRIKKKKKKKVPNVFFCVWVDLIVCWDNEKELRQMN